PEGIRLACWYLLQLPERLSLQKITELGLSFSLMQNKLTALAEILWNYHHVHQVLENADCIFALGSHDLRVADRTADLYIEGRAPLVIFSGGLGNLTREIWTESEADQFARIAIKRGVPEKAILVENKSTNTGENVLFTQKLLRE